MDTLAAPPPVAVAEPALPPDRRARWPRWVLAVGAVLLVALVGVATAGRNPSPARSTALSAPAVAGLAHGRAAGSAGTGVVSAGPAAGAAPAPGSKAGGPAGTAPGAFQAPGGLAPAPAPPPPGGLAPGTAPGGVAPGTAPAVDGALGRVVKSGAVALVVRPGRVSPTLTAVQDAGRAEGGYVADSSSEEYGGSPSGEVTIRVPVDRFERLVARIRALDAKVRTATTTGRDVTAQYADMVSALRTLRAARERFLVILGQAKTISEILTVQQRVDDVSGQIDRIEGDRQLLASQSGLSTLTVSVSLASDPVVAANGPPRSGLSQAWADARDGFVTGLEGIIGRSGRAALVLLCVGALALLGSRVWRVARRRLV